MKKITLLMIFILLTHFSFSQIALSEDFNAALTVPTGWTNDQIVTSGNLWTAETGGYAKYFPIGNTTFYTVANFSGNYAIFDSDAYAGGPEETALTSPVIDCSALTTVVLSVKHLYVQDAISEGHIEVYDGSAWQTVDSYSTTNVTANTYIFGSLIIDVTSHLAGVSNAQVRFRWSGDNSYYWGIDDLVVEQPTVSAPNAATTPTPVDGATNIPIDITGATPLITPFSWVAATTGDPAANFNLTLGTNTAGDNIGTVSSATSGNGVTYGNWAYNTTYYWSIAAINAGGSTQSTVWSFTTEMDPNLSTEDFDDNNAISHFYDTNTDVLTFTSSTLSFDNVEVYSVLGQQVFNKKLSQTRETINLSSLTDGIYIAKVSMEGKTQTIKFVKQ